VYVASLNREGVGAVSKEEYPFARTAVVLLLFIGGLSLGRGSAQSLIDEVHINPPSESLHPFGTEEIEPALNTHTASFKASVDLVLVSVTITDPHERSVIGLGQKNFEVFEGRNRQEIRHVSAEDAPISLGVILDLSGSMSSKIEKAREAVVEFLKTANQQDEFFIVTFADQPEEMSDFTTSVDEVRARLLYTVPKGRTALLDAIYLGISKMRQARYQKRALLIISDGGDNHSRYTEGEIKALVREADVLLYAVGIYDRFFPTPEEQLGPWLLTDLTEITGGRTYTIDNPNALPSVAKAIGIQLRNQYVIGYRPNSERNGKWHKIKVKLRALKGLPPLRVRAKAGYYAPTE
jgi:Ca-activated chloride channel family protein